MKFFGSLVVALWGVYLITQNSFNPVFGQDNNDTNNGSNLNNDWSYCFEFTWFGPNYDNFTQYNGTCADYIDETRAVNIPCRPPIVISYDGTPPDISWLWKNHRASVLCRRASNKVCARHTYSYNGQVENATYMCTKVMAIEDESAAGAVKSGCYTQMVSGYEVELCVCESDSGLYPPCNKGF